MRYIIEHQCLLLNDKNWVRPHGPKDKNHYSFEKGWSLDEFSNSELIQINAGHHTFHCLGGHTVLADLPDDVRILTLLTTVKGGKVFLVGVAADATHNRKSLPRASWPRLEVQAWRSEAIQSKFGGREKFRRSFYAELGKHSRPIWKCPENLYWFPGLKEQIEVTEREIQPASGKTLNKRHSNSQQILPTEALFGFLRKVGCPSSILAWTNQNHAAIRRGHAVAGNKKPRAKDPTNRSAKEEQTREVKYITKVQPHHNKLEQHFEKSLPALLQKNGDELKVPMDKNVNFVDATLLTRKLGTVLVEIKPARTEIEARIAARQAVGQLFFYSAKYGKNHRLMIYLGHRPEGWVVETLKHLNFLVAWKHRKTSKWG